MRARLPETVACVFDAYGTLFDFLSASDRCRDALGDKADALGLLWRTRQLEYSWLRSLMGAHADFWQVTGEALDFVMASLGISNAALRDRLMDLFLRIEAFPDARRVLEALKRAGRPAHILSNGSPAMLESAMKSASVEGLLQGLISVESAGVYKPHRSAYELVTRNLKLPPERSRRRSFRLPGRVGEPDGRAAGKSSRSARRRDPRPPCTPRAARALSRASCPNFARG